MNTRERFVDNVRRAETFLILTHIIPDGDAISSSIAMYYILVGLGKKPENIEVYIPHISKDLSFIDKDNIATRNCTMKDPDLVIVVDCSNYSRVEGSELLEGIDSQHRIIVDHHEKAYNPIEAECALVDAAASSCTCIIYRDFSRYICEQNRDSFFRCVAIGIMSDTIGLTFNVTEESRSTLNHCEKMGIDIQAISKQLGSIDARTQTLANLAIKRLVLDQEIGCTYILQSDLMPDEYSLKTVNHKAIIQQILNTASCNTLILLIENDNHEIKGSIRTTISNIDLSYICRSMIESKQFLQGGGHSNSAGFKMATPDTTTESLNRIFRLLISAILEQQ